MLPLKRKTTSLSPALEAVFLHQTTGGSAVMMPPLVKMEPAFVWVLYLRVMLGNTLVRYITLLAQPQQELFSTFSVSMLCTSTLENRLIRSCLHADPPSASVSPSQTVAHHETPSLTCNFKGFPTVSVRWLKDGQILERQHTTISTVITAPRIGEGMSQLTLKNLHKQDSGTYTCQVSNDLGSGVGETHLLVQCKW